MVDPKKDPDPTREAMARAIRRLNVLEFLILGAAFVFALAGGALAAWLLSTALGVSFGISWLVASVLLFVVPGGLVYLREHRAGSTRAARDSNPATGEPDGG